MTAKIPDPQPESLLTRLAARVNSILAARRWKKSSFAHGRMSQNTVLNILHGKNCRVSTLVELADALDCDLVIDIQPRSMEHTPEPDPQHIAHES